MLSYSIFCSGQSFLDFGFKITLVKFRRLDVSLSVLSD